MRQYVPAHASVCRTLSERTQFVAVTFVVALFAGQILVWFFVIVLGEHTHVCTLQSKYGELNVKCVGIRLPHPPTYRPVYTHAAGCLSLSVRQKHCRAQSSLAAGM
jgi:hypothetical protein